MGAVLQLFPALIGESVRSSNERYADEANVKELQRSQRFEDSNIVAAYRSGAIGVGTARERGTATAGAARVAYAANGVDSSSGTAAQVQAASLAAAELDASNLRANALAEALGHQETARKYGLEEERLKARHSTEGFMSPAEGESMLRMSSSVLGAIGGMFGGG